MNEGEIRQLAQLEALITERDAVMVEVEAMKALNTFREMRNETIAYDDAHFFDAQAKLEEIAKRMRDEI